MPNRERLLRARNGHGCEPLTGRRSLALLHRCLPSGPRTRTPPPCRSFTHQSSVPPVDHVADSTAIGGLTFTAISSGKPQHAPSLRSIHN